MRMLQNPRIFQRSLATGKLIFNKPPSGTSPTAKAAIPDVPGLSSNVVKIPNEPVGPGAAKTTNYKNPEYFSYDKTSYFQAEVEMLKYRCPQPSVKQYFKPSSA